MARSCSVVSLLLVLIVHLASLASASPCSKFSPKTVTCSRCTKQSTPDMDSCVFCPHETTDADPISHCHKWSRFNSRHKCAVDVKDKNAVCLGRTEQVQTLQGLYFVGSIYVDDKGLMCKNVPRQPSPHKLGREALAIAADKSFSRATRILGSNAIQYLRSGVIAVRGDHRHPEEVFRTGFKPRRSGENCVSSLSETDTILHQVNNHEYTYCHFISTSLCTGVAAGSASWVYVMVVPEGYDLHWSKKGGDMNVELIALGDVPPQYIYAARSVENSDHVSHSSKVSYMKAHLGTDKFVAKSTSEFTSMEPPVIKNFNDFVEFNTGFDQSIVTNQETEHMLRMLYVKRAQGKLVDDMSYAESG